MAKLNHYDAGARKKLGQQAEREFAQAWLCRCGAAFDNVSMGYWDHDFQCPECGLWVDVKADAVRGGSIAISQRPFDAYPDELVIAWRGPFGKWLGARMRDARKAVSGPFPPAHKERGTPFYKIRVSIFQDLARELRRRTLL